MRSPYFTSADCPVEKNRPPAGRAVPLRHSAIPCGYSWHFDRIPGRAYGGLRITGAPHEAQVLADGYYVEIVDDFDGVFQHPTASEALRLA